MKHFYCRKCKFYELLSTDWGSNEYCHHPSNKRIDHCHRGPITKFLAEPKNKNCNASCQDFVERPPRMSFMNFVRQAFGREWK